MITSVLVFAAMMILIAWFVFDVCEIKHIEKIVEKNKEVKDTRLEKAKAYIKSRNNICQIKSTN
jgi:hypothetical protein